MRTLFIRSSALLALSIGAFASVSLAQDAVKQPGEAFKTPPIEFPLPKGEEAYGDIDGKHLWQLVAQQAKIATDYRDHGHPQYWGRIAGTSADDADVQWLMDKYRKIGLTDVHAQIINYFLPQWAPKGWTVTLSGGGKETKLVSAQASYGSPDTKGKDLDLEAVYVGLGSEADFAGRDVRGKAVVMVIGPLLHNIGTPDVRKRAMAHGAAAILGFEVRDGNHMMQTYNADTNVPTFHLGNADGEAIRDLIASGAHPHLKINLDGGWANQKSYIVWGTLPGVSDENIYVWAHRDGWFQAAGDNATGVATMLGLAEHYAKIPKEQRQRTMIFMGTDGHHNSQAFGEAWLIANRAKLFAKTALMVNGEHTAERATHGGVGTTNMAIPMQWYAGGASRPQLTKIASDAFHEFGVPLWSEPGKMGAGVEVDDFHAFAPAVAAASNDFLEMHYETDTPDNIPWPALQSVTRAYAKIIDEANKLSLKDLQRPEATSEVRQRLDLSHCQAWLQDSSKACTP